MPNDVQAYNRALIDKFRANHGAPDGRPLLLLTTVGARTGQARTTPLMYIPDGERLLVVASAAGAPRDPDWYRNLVAHGQVTVEVGPDTYQARAVVLTGDEYERVWADLQTRYPFFADHQAKVTRQIPVVALQRAAS